MSLTGASFFLPSKRNLVFFTFYILIKTYFCGLQFLPYVQKINLCFQNQVGVAWTADCVPSAALKITQNVCRIVIHYCLALWRDGHIFVKSLSATGKFVQFVISHKNNWFTTYGTAPRPLELRSAARWLATPRIWSSLTKALWLARSTHSSRTTPMRPKVFHVQQHHAHVHTKGPHD